jgi:hypothetical protein
MLEGTNEIETMYGGQIPDAFGTSEINSCLARHQSIDRVVNKNKSEAG